MCCKSTATALSPYVEAYCQKRTQISGWHSGQKEIFANPVNSMSAASLGHEHTHTYCHLQPENIFRHKIGQVYFLKIILPVDKNFFFFFTFLSYSYPWSAISVFDRNITYCCQLTQSAGFVWKHTLWPDPKLA